MSTYIIRRLLLIIPTFIGITLMVFAITRMVPGGPIERMIAEAQQSSASRGFNRMNSNPLSAVQLEELKKYYGFDKPVIISYGEWLGSVLVLDLGNSTRYYEPVWDLIRSKLPVSLFYGIMAMILTYSICIPLGVLKALRHKTTLDNLTSVIVFIGYAIPNYVVAIILLITFSSWLDIFPLGGFTGSNFHELTFGGKIIDVLYHAVLPLTAYMAGSFAVMTFMMKNSLLDYLASDFMRTAIAKGASYKQAVFRHAFRNSLIPLATHFGNNISIILTGSYLIEKIFNIDGIGLLGLESVVERDYPTVLGILVISSLLFMIGNILSDICVALVDPRVKFE
ncbi:MAG: peptide ABC transporter permease [Spirochaetae bacterium HGW-Spirochaetae-5]|nr:MAG: peptide ABC transporter permease [Spirochaetae bacterium HGW-Spirochaetae-5]